MTPKISVITPLYNGEKWIVETLESLRNQTFQDFEALLVDDGSTDGGAAIVQSVAHNDKRFYYIPKPHGGIAHSRNWGIREAKGEFITFLDQDDLYYPRKLEEQIDVLVNSKNHQAVYCAIERIDAESRSLGLPTPYRIKGNAFKTMLHRMFAMSILTVLVRRSIVEKAGLLDEALFGLDDYDWLLRVASVTDFGYIDKPLVRQRFRLGTSGQNEKMFLDRFIVADKIRRQWPSIRRDADRYEQYSHYFYGSYLLENKRYSDARFHLLKALYLKPWDIKAVVKCLLTWR